MYDRCSPSDAGLDTPLLASEGSSFVQLCAGSEQEHEMHNMQHREGLSVVHPPPLGFLGPSIASEMTVASLAHANKGIDILSSRRYTSAP